MKLYNPKWDSTSLSEHDHQLLRVVMYECSICGSDVGVPLAPGIANVCGGCGSMYAIDLETMRAFLVPSTDAQRVWDKHSGDDGRLN